MVENAGFLSRMAVKLVENSLIWRWFELYLRLGGTQEWRSNSHLLRKILVDAPILWLFSPIFDAKFRIPPAFLMLLGCILGIVLV